MSNCTTNAAVAGFLDLANIQISFLNITLLLACFHNIETLIQSLFSKIFNVWFFVWFFTVQARSQFDQSFVQCIHGALN